MSNTSFPNESTAYREARNALLRAEEELRDQAERVAAQRQGLPLGGEIPVDYAFAELVGDAVKQVALSELFGSDRDTLFVYSFMYGPNMDSACPMCTALLDGLDGQVPHLEQQISTAVVARHDIHTLHEYARGRGWQNLRLLSSKDNTYNVDYRGELDGTQRGVANVFVRRDGRIHHFWHSELHDGPAVENGNTRHLDLIWPLWNVLDLTPGGRGGFFPSLRY